jgi:type II secretory pathway component PulL
MYVFNARQRAQYLSVLLTLPAPQSEERAKALRETLQSYAKELFPYHARAVNQDAQQMQAIMERELLKGPTAVVADMPTQSKRSRKQSKS